MGLFSFFSKGSNIAAMKEKNAVVIDVRTPGEFAGGHVKGSKNYPLQSISGKMNEIKKLNRPVIFCCASGVRSAQASSMYKKAGGEGMNGGGWRSVAKYY